MTITLDRTDRALVNLLQADFPLVREPFAAIALRLGLKEKDILERLEILRNKRIIRILGPVFNSRTLGYQSTLVAMRVSKENIDPAAQIINQHPGVGHNYQRDHYYNLWFTLAIRSSEDIREALQQFEEQIHPEAMFELPAIRLFKIRLFFDLEGNGNHSEDDSSIEIQHAASLADIERAVINEVQQQLPAISRPFDRMADKLSMETNDFLAICRSLLDCGVMRRFGASIEHQNAGFVANAMVCWAVPSERVEEVGQTMAAFKEVTHCYERKTNPLWPRYNVFAMIHGGTRQENEETIARIAQATGISEYEILSTVREFKKERVKYRV